MKTTLEVTLRISIQRPDSPLDENSVKSLINQGIIAIADNVDLLSTISDESVESICVQVIRLKENGKRYAVSTYGTDDVPWGRE
jgi:hypothetical protein